MDLVSAASALDHALFELINLGPTAPAWAVEAARLASRLLPGMALAWVAVSVLRPSQRRLALSLAIAMALAWLAAKGLKACLPTHRPFALGLGTQWAAHGASASFPSVHSTVAAAWAASWQAVTGREARRSHAVRLAWAIALVVAWSRIALGLHFPSDVATGLALGFIVGWLAARTLRRRVLADWRQPA